MTFWRSLRSCSGSFISSESASHTRSSISSARLLLYLFEGVRLVAILDDDIPYCLRIPPSPILRRPRTIALERERARQRAAAAGPSGPHFARTEWLAPLEACEVRCLRCEVVDDLTVDHVVPLALGGPNTIYNIQPPCAVRNNLKGRVILDYRLSEAIA